MKNKYVAPILLGLVAVTAFVAAVAGMPLDDAHQAVDWKSFYQVTHPFQIDYTRSEIFHPPWSLALLWPLTAWALPVSRGLAALATVAVFLVSVPRHPKRWHWISSVLLLAFSIPMLRHLVDGNIEAMVVGGALLAMYAINKISPGWLAFGLILMSAKAQASWLLFLFIAYYLWQHWPRKALLQTAAYGLIGIAPAALWRGAQWVDALRAFPYTDTLVNSSLLNTLALLGTPALARLALWAAVLAATLWVAWGARRRFGRAEVGFLVAAGLLLATYAASNSAVTPLALGVIPFFQRRPKAGLLLIVLYYLPYLGLARPDLRLAWQTVYWGVVMTITWLVLLIDVWQTNRAPGDLHPAGLEIDLISFG